MSAPPPERRFPRRVYCAGVEPDPRFSLANERTFLAWLRTGLALMAAGVALHALDLPISAIPRYSASVLLVALGVVATGNGWLSWARAERALRVGRPLPGPGAGLPLVAGVIVAGLLIAVGLVLG